MPSAPPWTIPKDTPPEIRSLILMTRDLTDMFWLLSKGDAKGVLPWWAKPLAEKNPFLKDFPIAPAEDKRFRFAEGRGWKRYADERTADRLTALRDRGLLDLTDAEIELLQRISNVETSGMIHAINSWDSEYMSMGFMQWPVTFGKAQRLIAEAPEAFRKYGIELDPPRQFRRQRDDGRVDVSDAIKGVNRLKDLRDIEWAKRFYAAGLDDEILVAEAKLALVVVEETKQKLVDVNKVGREFLPYYDDSVVLRALIQETHNHRPAFLIEALKRSNRQAGAMEGVTTEKFLEMTRDNIKDVYKEEGEKLEKKGEEIKERGEKAKEAAEKAKATAEHDKADAEKAKDATKVAEAEKRIKDAERDVAKAEELIQEGENKIDNGKHLPVSAQNLVTKTDRL